MPELRRVLFWSATIGRLKILLPGQGALRPPEGSLKVPSTGVRQAVSTLWWLLSCSPGQHFIDANTGAASQAHTFSLTEGLWRSGQA